MFLSPHQNCKKIESRDVIFAKKILFARELCSFAKERRGTQKKIALTRFEKKKQTVEVFLWFSLLIPLEHTFQLRKVTSHFST